MRRLVVGLSLLLGSLACTPTDAEEPADAALNAVLTNIARYGYRTSLKQVGSGRATTEDVLLWSQRILEAESGQIKVDGFAKAAAIDNLARIKRFRDAVNLADTLESARADFAYQQARAIAAKSDDSQMAQWSRDISDLGRLQGTWKEVRSKRLGEGEPEDLVLRVVGGISFFRWGGAYADGLVDLNARLFPGHIDCFGLNWDYGHRTIGVYVIDGDELHLSCRHGQGEHERPTSFSASKDYHHVVYTLRRLSTKEAALHPISHNVSDGDVVHTSGAVKRQPSSESPHRPSAGRLAPSR